MTNWQRLALPQPGENEMPCGRLLIHSMAVLTTFGLLVTTAQAENAKLTEIRVYPTEVTLKTNRDRQTIIVQSVDETGITRDVTKDSKLTLDKPEPVLLKGNTLYPQADGEAKLTVTYGGHQVVVPIQVAEAKADRPISFRLDVMPVFMKGGCNTGSCHGAARGKDGFRLSLFGFDPAGDYFRLTRELPERRINLANPVGCLLMEKVTGVTAHTGGKRFALESEMGQTLMRWLKASVPDDAGEVPAVLSLHLYPPNAVLDGDGTEQQLNVLARYADGTTRDVTSLAYFMSSNGTSASVDQKGVVTAHARGEAFLMARYETHTTGSQFIVLPKGFKFTDPKTPTFNYIDKFVHQKLNKLRIIPSEVCSDEVFLRRVYLDIVGVLPNEEEYSRFLGSSEPKKREQLVDELLSRKEFVEIWVMKWAELLTIRTTQQISYKAMLRYYNWLQDKIANNVSMDVMVQELLGSNGGTFTNAATNYYQNETNTLKVSENVAQVFMGMRIQCTQCHNHPFDRWTMNDYYSFGAFFSQIGRKTGEDPREVIVFNSGGGEVKHLVGGRVMKPKFLGGEEPDVSGKDRRVVMAKWLASPQNPYFARNLANIVWSHFMGRGIIEPVDDVRVSNPAVNEELLSELATRFTNYKYDFKKLVRDICLSRTYQLSTQTNETNQSDLTNFSHGALRRIRAEILYDAISQVTETKDKFPGLPLGARAVQIANGNTSSYFLTTFGRAKRESVCSCEVKMEPNLSQALHLINGTTANSKIQSGKLIERRVAETKAALDAANKARTTAVQGQETAAKNLTAVQAKVKQAQQTVQETEKQLADATKAQQEAAAKQKQAIEAAQKETDNKDLQAAAEQATKATADLETKRKTLEQGLADAKKQLAAVTVEQTAAIKAKQEADALVAKADDQIKIVTSQANPQRVIQDLYVRCLSRKPTASEIKSLTGILASAKVEEQQQVLEDIFWSLLNSQEFLFNH